ncbi:hypothetical protein [Sulfurovum lithotrophicum]|nr:hypothetical protein [Sulfurovum lithotrophicum]
MKKMAYVLSLFISVLVVAGVSIDLMMDRKYAAVGPSMAIL